MGSALRVSALEEARQWAAGKQRADLSLVPANVGFTAGYVPSAKQALLHASDAPNLLYGGAAGGGKSRGFREDMRLFALLTPNANVLLMRRTHTELRDNHWVPAMLEWRGDGAKFNSSDHTVTFPNGSRVIFGHCHNDGDVMRYLGQEYDRVYFDELTTFTEAQYDMVCGRLRTTKPGVKPRAIGGTNPGGIGHLWVRQRWIDRDSSRDDGTRRDLTGYEFIQALLSDNPLIDTPEYRARLEALSSAKRRAYLDGDWDIFEGQYFKSYSAARHICKPFPIPTAWPKGRSLDYGGTAPFCCLWWALDPSSSPMRMYVYREYYRAGALLDHNAREVVRLSEGEQYRWSVGDPSMWAKGPTERGSLADQCRTVGLHLTPATNERLAGWQLCDKLLTGDDNGPLVQFMEGACPNLIRTLPALVHDERHVEDVDTHGEDHAPDAWRYGAMAAFGAVRRVSGETPAVAVGLRQLAAGSRFATQGVR